MRAFWVASVLCIAALLAAPSALACRVPVPLNLDGVEHADLIVVGRLSRYEFVADQAAWERQRRSLQDPDLTPELRHILERQRSQARFRISVRQTLRGEAPRTLTATLDDAAFETLFALAPGEHLVALVRHDRQGDDQSAYAVLQDPCGGSFLFPNNGRVARAVRERLLQ